MRSAKWCNMCRLRFWKRSWWSGQNQNRCLRLLRLRLLQGSRKQRGGGSCVILWAQVENAFVRKERNQADFVWKNGWILHNIMTGERCFWHHSVSLLVGIPSPDIAESQEAGDQNDLKEASENWKLEIIKNLATWKLKTRKSKDRETEPLTCFKGSQMLKNPSAHMFSLRLNFCCFWVFSQPENDGKPTRKAVLRFSDPWWRWKRPLCNGRRN